MSCLILFKMAGPFVEWAKCFKQFRENLEHILATLFNAFFLVHDSENPKFADGSLNIFPCTIIIYYPGFQSRFNLLFTEGPAALESRVIY